MDRSTLTPGFHLEAFGALRLADSHVGDPVAHRVLSRPYRAVPGRIAEWRRKRRLAVDEEPAIYVHEYTSNGVTVRGVVGLLDIARASGRLYPHEAVHVSQVDQLADRLEAMRINPAPILLMHRGRQDTRAQLDAVMSLPPDLVYTDRADQLHRIWRVEGADRTAALAASLVDTRAVIADGHHRYEASRRLDARHPGTGWASTLVMLVDQDDTPLQLGAVHRSVPRLTMPAAAERSAALGALWTDHPTSHRALAHLDHALVLHDGESWATLEPAEPQDLLVRWLHEQLLPAWAVREDRVSFHHSASEALARASLGLSVLLPAPRFQHVSASAVSGILLPQKATSFQPKPHVGVLMRIVPESPDVLG